MFHNTNFILQSSTSSWMAPTNRDLQEEGGMNLVISHTENGMVHAGGRKEEYPRMVKMVTRESSRFVVISSTLPCRTGEEGRPICRCKSQKNILAVAMCKMAKHASKKWCTMRLLFSRVNVWALCVWVCVCGGGGGVRAEVESLARAQYPIASRRGLMPPPRGRYSTHCLDEGMRNIRMCRAITPASSGDRHDETCS